MADLADALLHAFLARSKRTFEAIVCLDGRGFGEQAAMFNRSLFEDMVDGDPVGIDHGNSRWSACASITATATASNSTSPPPSRRYSAPSCPSRTRR